MNFNMSLFDEIATANTNNKPGPGCGVAKALESMEAADAADVVRAMASDMKGSVISDVLKEKRDIRVSGFTIQWHRRGRCSCEPVPSAEEIE